MDVQPETIETDLLFKEVYVINYVILIKTDNDHYLVDNRKEQQDTVHFEQAVNGMAVVCANSIDCKAAEVFGDFNNAIYYISVAYNY